MNRILQRIRATILYQWLTSTVGKIFSLLAVLCTVVAIFKLPIDISETGEKYKNHFFKIDIKKDSILAYTPLFAENFDSVVKIIILPLHPDEKCNLQQVDYDRNIVERFNHLKQEGYEIIVKYDSTLRCPTDSQVKLLVKRNNADAIVFGYYDEQCSDFSKRVKFKLAFANDNHLGIWETNYEKVVHMEELADGQHQKLIEDVIKFLIAKRLIKIHDYEHALARLNSITNVNEHIYTIGLKIRCLEGLHRNKDVIAMKKEIFQYYENEPSRAMYALGRAYEGNGDTALALEQYKMSLRLANDSSMKCSEYFSLAVMYYGLGRITESVLACNEGLNFSASDLRKDADILNVLALCHIKLKKYDMAIDDLKRAIQDAPFECTYRQLLGDVYLQTNKIELSNTEYQECLNLGCLPDTLTFYELYFKNNPHNLSGD